MGREITLLVEKCLREIGEQEGMQISQDLHPETSLFGRDGLLDSVALVSLVASVEQSIEDRYGVSISLADEKAMSQKRSPFRTIAALADYAGRLIQENV